MKFRETIWGGITGALLFAGIYIVLIITVSYAGRLLPASGSAVQKLLDMNKWTFEGIYAAFIVAVSVGVISGSLVGWKCPQITKKWFAPIASLGIPAILVGWFLYVYAGHVDIPRNKKLTNCTNDTLRVQFTVPKGRLYSLELSIPSGSTNVFSGHVSILDAASTITNFFIGSTHTEEQCSFLHAQINYDMEIAFDQPPPPSTSIWLHWLQAYKDKDK